MSVKFDTTDIIATVRAAGFAVPGEIVVSWKSREIQVFAAHAATLDAVHAAEQVARALDDAGYVVEDYYGTTYVMVTGVKVPRETVITEADIIATLRPEHKFAVATNNNDRANTILGIGFDLATRLAETNGWDTEARKAFIDRLFK